MIHTMAWMEHVPTSVGMFRRRYAKWIGEENAWGYRAPMTLLPGEVPTDVLTRLQQGCSKLRKARDGRARIPSNIGGLGGGPAATRTRDRRIKRTGGT